MKTWQKVLCGVLAFVAFGAVGCLEEYDAEQSAKIEHELSIERATARTIAQKEERSEAAKTYLYAEERKETSRWLSRSGK